MLAWKVSAAAVVVLAVGSAAVAGPPAHPIDCAARLVAVKNGGKPATGTATYVYRTDNGPCFLVTAYHCLHEFDSVTVEATEKGVPEFKLTDLVEKSFICSPASDLCVFKVTPAGKEKLAECGRRPAKLADASPPAATHVVAVGNPVVVLLGAEQAPFSWVSGATVSQTGSFGQRVGPEYADGDARLTPVVMLESLQITRGFSGGPVLRSASNFTKDDREVVGIVQGGDPNKEKLSWCIAAEQVAKLIDAGADQWEAYPPAGPWRPQQFKSKAYSRTAEKLVVGFPLKFSTGDTLDDGFRWKMDTTVTISENGRLDGVTRTWATRNVGFNGEVIVFLCDASGNVLWRTKERHTYGLSLLNMDRTERWDVQVPPDVLARVSKCLIHHQDSPKRLEDALGLATVRLGDSEVRILKELAKAKDIPWVKAGER